MHRFRTLVVLTLALASVGLATQISDRLQWANSTFPNGLVRISWATFVTTSGQTVQGGSIPVQITSGYINVTLQPYSGYTAQYTLSPGSVSYIEYWVVPDSSTPVTVSMIRTNTVPSSNMLLSMSQLAQSGATTGQALVWNGALWWPGNPAAAATWGAVTGTLSNQTDLATALSGKEPSITTGGTSQYWRGDKTWRSLATDIYALISATSPLVFNSTTGAFTCPSCGSGAVASVFGRTGAVVSAVNDYSFSQIAGSLAIAQINATGTASSGTFLRGDGIWAPSAGGVSSVFGRAGVITAQSGDYTAAQVTNAADMTGSYSNPSWITALAGAKVTGNIAGNSGTTSGFVSTPSLCPTGQAPTGVDAHGNATGCASISGGGATSAGQLTDCQVIRTSATVLTACPNASSTTPVNFKVGMLITSIIAPIPITLSGTPTAQIFTYFDTTAMAYTVAAGTTGATCSTPCAFNSLTGIPTDKQVPMIPGYQWQATAGSWNAGATADLRAVYGVSGNTISGSGVSTICTAAGCVTTPPYYGTKPIGATFSGGGSAITAGTVVYYGVPFACTIAGWIATVDTGTITFDVWKIATGTAIPTITNTITASALPAIASGTALHSTTLTGWSTAVSAYDIFAFQAKTVSGATMASIVLECAQ